MNKKTRSAGYDPGRGNHPKPLKSWVFSRSGLKNRYINGFIRDSLILEQMSNLPKEMRQSLANTLRRAA